ncbi:MAG: hypothetical protein IMZ53_15345 [Thermoplasmata archaeon]|nr:hypothetical protein [Thermoplasmata archaeon]
MSFVAITATYIAVLFLGMIIGTLLTAYSLYQERKRKGIGIPYKFVVRDIFNEEVYKKK